jgi:hypothetical protein
LQAGFDEQPQGVLLAGAGGAGSLEAHPHLIPFQVVQLHIAAIGQQQRANFLLQDGLNAGDLLQGGEGRGAAGEGSVWFWEFPFEFLESSEGIVSVSARTAAIRSSIWARQEPQPPPALL